MAFSKGKRIAFALVAVAIGLASPFLALEVLLRFFPVTSSMQKMVVDESHPIIHYPPNREFVYSKGWNFEVVNSGRFNNYGFVNGQDYRRKPEENVLAIIGDSYVEAIMIPYEQTVHGRLARLYGNDGRVYSFGISGSQLAQYVAFAQYAWSEFRPRAMVFVIVGNDFDESALRMRAGLYIFEEDATADALKLVRTDYKPTVLEKILNWSVTARYLWSTVGIRDPVRTMERKLRLGESLYVGNTSADANVKRVRDSQRLIDTFFGELRGRVGLERSQILFVVDGMRPQLYDERELKRAHGSYFDLMRQYFIQAATARGYEVLDMQPIFMARHRADGSSFEFAIDAHWNSVGHQVVAEAIASSRLFQGWITAPHELQQREAKQG